MRGGSERENVPMVHTSQAPKSTRRVNDLILKGMGGEKKSQDGGSARAR